MTQQTQAVTVAKESREISFIPFGSDASDEIRLNITLVKNFVAVKTKSGNTCTDEQAMKAMMFMKARRLNPYENDCYLIGYDTQDGPQFSVVASHQSYLKRAEIHPEFDGMESGVIVRNEDGSLSDLQGDFHTEDQILVGGWAKVHFKTRRVPMFKKLKLGTFNKGMSQWKTNPNGMIVKCAEADALRSAFPSTLGGMFLREEVELDSERSTVVQPTRSSLVNPVPDEPKALAAPKPPQPKQEPRRPEVTNPPPRPKRETAEQAAVSSPTPVPVAAPEPPPTNDAPTELADELTENDPFADPGSVGALDVKSDGIKPLAVPKNVEECAQLIRQSLAALALTEDMLMTWCKGTQPPLANSRQTTITQMAGSKLVTICEQWPAIVNDLQAGF